MLVRNFVQSFTEGYIVWSYWLLQFEEMTKIKLRKVGWIFTLERWVKNMYIYTLLMCHFRIPFFRCIWGKLREPMHLGHAIVSRFNDLFDVLVISKIRNKINKTLLRWIKRDTLRQSQDFLVKLTCVKTLGLLSPHHPCCCQLSRSSALGISIWSLYDLMSM